MTMGERKRPHLPPIQTWTFKDGWASNIVVIGAVVAAIITALGSLGPETFGDFSVANFVGLNLVFAAMVLVAPLTYSAFRKRVVRDQQQAETTAEQPHQQERSAIAGTVLGLMTAAAAVLWAAFGQLTTLFIVALAATDEPEELFLQGGLLLLAAFFVFLYAWKSLGWTVNGYAELSPEEQLKLAKTQTEIDAEGPIGTAVQHRTITL